MPHIIYWCSLSILAYTFFGFFVLLFIVSFIKRKPVLKKDIEPTVSIIICAYNEAKKIREKIENCLALDYPHEKLEIIVVSDGSTDGTDAIVKNYRHPRVHCLSMPERRGKSHCQNMAAALAKHEILFFTDATAMHPPQALKILLRSLADPNVGCVTGRPLFRKSSSMTSQGLEKRERYELLLRRNLNECLSLFGAQDCMYAIPRSIFPPTRDDLDSGFVGPLQLLVRGYRTVYEFDAIAFIERRPPTLEDEVARRSRIVLRGLRGLIYMKQLLNPFSYGFTAVALLSSRLLRWISPVFLTALFFSNIFLLGRHPWYQLSFMLQALFYLTAAVAFFCEKKGVRLQSVLCVPYFFCVLMWSAVLGIKNLLCLQTGQVWETRR